MKRGKSLHVLLLAEDFYPKESGGAFIDWNVAKHLAGVGHSVIVVTPRKGRLPASETVEGVEIRRPFRGPASATHPNSTEGIFWRLFFVSSVIPYLIFLGFRRRFDVVYSTNHLCHLPAFLFSKAFNLSHVSFVGYSPSIRGNVSIKNPFVLLERINFRFFMGERVLCRTPDIHSILQTESDATISRLDGILDAQKIKQSIPSTNGMENECDTGKGTRLVFVGRLVKIKKVVTLPGIVAKLPEEYSMLIIGEGPERERVEAAVDKANVGDRVDLVGQLPHRETLRAIYDSDILVFASKAESYGAVVFEALSLNTPVLATPVGILPMIEHPNLTTAPLEEFPELLPEIQTNNKEGIDEETLKSFSVVRFTEDVERHLQEAATSTH